MAESLFVGLMSGTSVDGIDAVLVDLDPSRSTPKLLASHSTAMPSPLRDAILALSTPGNLEIDRLGELDVLLGQLFAESALAVIDRAGASRQSVRAIGSHGQTLRHRPTSATPFTLQIGDPNVIAEVTGITTVADFRRRDIAAGGQGAPLVPAFHDAVFRHPDEDRVVLNIGGMANVTVLDADPASPVRGFDTGPGNVLLDGWHQLHRQTCFDRDGLWAASGQVDEGLLAELLDDPWLDQPPPRSTGREAFSVDMLLVRLASVGEQLRPEDVQATLAEFTAVTVSTAIRRWGTSGGTVFLCGGGTHNLDLRRRLGRLLTRHRLSTTSELDVDPDFVEAMAFAWLAECTLAGKAGNRPEVTGASHPVVLGGIYPGRLGWSRPDDRPALVARAR